jgi:cation:H+ antiporter
VAVGNILGGIAIQTVVLVVLDAVGVRGRHPLTYRAASLVLVLEGLAVIAVLAAVVGGTQLPDDVIVWRVTAGGAAHRGALGREPPARPPRGSRTAVARVR